MDKFVDSIAKYVPVNFFPWLETFMELTGLHKPSNKNFKLMIPFLIVHSIICCWIQYICTLINLFESTNVDFITFMINVAFATLETVLLARITMYYVLRDKIKKIIHIISRSSFNFDCFSVISIDDSKLSKKATTNASKNRYNQLQAYWKQAMPTFTEAGNAVETYRKRTMFYTRLLCCILFIILNFVAFFTTISWYTTDAFAEFYEAFNPYLNKTSLYKQSAFRIYLPFDTSTDGYLCLALSIQYYAKLVLLMLFIPFEILLISLIIHLISQTMVVAEAFKYINKHIPDQTLGQKYLIMEIRIVKAINEMQEIYRLLIFSAFDVLKDVCSLQMLIHYGLATFMLCSLCYMIPMLKKAGEIIGCFMFLATLLGELTFFSYCSQTLTLELQKVALSVYAIEWEKHPLRIRRYIVFLLMRLQKPAILSAGKIFPIDFQFFILILQKAYSFYTLISATQK